ncbi:Respiratory supercomplex factor 1, mitochondrial [Vermiconidia calcicola]|uniref:Respiratory supercomplex factor 1, mitochondrial n=1 Tax=Vermiconidia calcicola TaxID=1690605 RepID=A0ACC3NVJ8_9PEZI|nr:Respiratory supercomplex factor 1, mitochondrial [Vermiconidia calcicola]
MSVPGNINTAPPPSSFDNDPDFYQESRWAKLRRRIIEEPLIPLGCALTVWALYEASTSIKKGDKHRTNRMFRRRIYAQGFTIFAMLGGSIYWEADRKRRQQFEGLSEEKKKKEKHEAWIRELEVREEEEQELRKLRDKIVRGQGRERKERMLAQGKEGVRSEVREGGGGTENLVKSVIEEDERRGPILGAVRDLWEMRR